MNRILIPLLLMALILVACQPSAPVDVPTAVPDTPIAPTSTPQPAATDTPVLVPTETAKTGEETSTPESGKVDIRATVAAMANQVTLVPPTPSTGASGNVIDPDDFVAMFELGWRIVRDNYVRDSFNGVDWDAIYDAYLPQAEAVENKQAFWDLMENLVHELGDDHSRFVRPERFGSEFDIELSNPQASGLGWTAMTIWPAREDERLLIWDVCEFGPAADAGLQRGDVILAVNGQPIIKGEEGFERSQYIDALVGTGRVTLTVLEGPGAEPRDVTLRYGGGANCGGWTYGFVSEDPAIGYIRVPDFGGDSDTNIYQLIQRMEEETPLEGLILDIRHNPGGNSDRDIAIFTEGVFGKVGTLRADGTQTIYRIRGPVRWSETTPLVVLTDGNSHSAADYFAIAMQESGRALLVGQPSAGNTEGISGFSLPDGSLIRLAVMTIELPDGSTIEGVGVQPDVSVPLGDWGLRETPDVQLQAAISEILRLIEANS